MVNPNNLNSLEAFLSHSPGIYLMAVWSQFTIMFSGSYNEETAAKFEELKTQYLLDTKAVVTMLRLPKFIFPIKYFSQLFCNTTCPPLHSSNCGSILFTIPKPAAITMGIFMIPLALIYFLMTIVISSGSVDSLPLFFDVNLVTGCLVFFSLSAMAFFHSHIVIVVYFSSG